MIKNPKEIRGWPMERCLVRVKKLMRRVSEYPERLEACADEIVLLLMVSVKQVLSEINWDASVLDVLENVVNIEDIIGGNLIRDRFRETKKMVQEYMGKTTAKRKACLKKELISRGMI